MQPIRFATLSADALRATSDSARLATAAYTRQERADIADALRVAQAGGVISGKELTRALTGKGRDHRVAALGKTIRRRVRKLMPAALPSLAPVALRADPTFDTPAHRATIASMIRSLLRVGAYEPATLESAGSSDGWSPAASLDAAILAYGKMVGERMAKVLGLEHLSAPDLALVIQPAFVALTEPDGPMTHTVLVGSHDELVGFAAIGDAFHPYARAVSDGLAMLSLAAVEILNPYELAKGEAFGAWIMENLEGYTTTAFDADDNFVVDDELTEHLNGEYGMDLADPEQVALIEKALRFLRANPYTHDRPSRASRMRGVRSAIRASNGRVAVGLRALELAVAWSARRSRPDDLSVGNDYYGGGDDGDGMPCTFAFNADLSGYEASFVEDMDQHCMQVGIAATTTLTATDSFGALTVALEDAWVITLLVHALGAASE